MASGASRGSEGRPGVLRLLTAASTGNLQVLKKSTKQLDDGRGVATTIAVCKDMRNCGALHFAAMEGKIEVCKYLLEELEIDVDPDRHRCRLFLHQDLALRRPAGDGVVDEILARGRKAAACWRSNISPWSLSGLASMMANSAAAENELSMWPILPPVADDQSDAADQEAVDAGRKFHGTDKKTSEEVRLFLMAVQQGDLGLVEKLASKLHDGRGMARTVAEAKDDEGRGALHFAALEGNIELCKYLLEALKLDVDPKDVYGNTPLQFAADLPQIETAEYLIDQGADPLIPNDVGLTVLHYSAGTGKIELLNLLHSKGFDVDFQTSHGSPLLFSVVQDAQDAVKFLLEHHANPDAENDYGLTPLFASVIDGLLECLKLLIQVSGGAKVNVTLREGETPLHIAASEGKLHIINCLLEAGADPNVRDENGMTPIEAAAREGNRAVVEILFPNTSEIKPIPWSVDGIMAYMQAQKALEEEAKQKAAEAKSRGDDAFRRKDYGEAVHAYAQALGFDPNEATLLSNRSLCWFHLGQGERALADAKACRELRPDWPKACYREGAALSLLQRFDEAANAFSEGVKLDPESKELEKAFRLG
ncbi:ankyrin-3-like [Rhodamnia argentea]|uniref:Ankyrin-3-like n=1 Tax=Rhodamnia argentea TaxID=178133 RepID=A0ABM3HC29_9MYRT|nr:ankyrin-3-like [Rhodamnia argentea]